jgi:nucleotide-binding universal stress UspA family protein
LLCHSVNWVPLIAEFESGGVVVDPNPIIDGLKQQAEALLTQAAETAKRLGAAAEQRTVEGEAAESILKLASEAECRLILMGNHGRRGLGRLFIGSTTEAVLRGSTVPVLTVRAGMKIAGETRRCFERIVVGIDDSEPSDAAIKTVLELPAEDRRHVLLCSVADSDSVIGWRDYHYPTILDDLQEQAQHVVDEAAAAARARNVAAEGQVVEGSTSDALIAAAQKEEADLIVLGSHGRRGIRRFFLGSVAESVVRAAPVPVLVVRTAASIPASSTS